jgi:hypothetical protein
VRLYVNFFQPSMKLRLKEREGGKLRRRYDPAKTRSNACWLQKY